MNAAERRTQLLESIDKFLEISSREPDPDAIEMLLLECKEVLEGPIHVPQVVIQKIENRALAFHYSVMADAADMLKCPPEFSKMLRDTSERFTKFHDGVTL